MHTRLSHLIAASAIALSGITAATVLMPAPASAAVATQIIPNAAYTLIESGSDDVMSIKGESESNLATLRLTYDNGGLAQRFHFRYESKYNAYSIINFRTLKAVGVENGTMAYNTPINQFTYQEYPAQLWNVVKSGSYYIIQSKANPSYYIGKNNNALVLSTVPVQWKLNEFKTGKVLNDGQYVIQKDGTNRVVDIKNASGASGAYAQIYRHNTSDAQLFNFTYNPLDATYTITNVNSGKALDRKEGKEQTSVWQYTTNNSDSQKWRIYKDIHGKYAILNANSRYGLASEKIPDLYDAGNLSEFDHGVALITDKPEQWTITDNSEYEIPDGTYSIYAAQGIVTNKYTKNKVTYTTTRGYMSLDIKNASKTNGANVQIYDANATLAQKFIIKNLGNGFVTLTNVGSGKVVDVKNGANKNGANIWQYGANGTYAQQWKIVFDKDGYVTFQSRLGNRVMDISSAKYVRGNNVHLWTANQTKAQKWIVTDAPILTYTKDQYIR